MISMLQSRRFFSRMSISTSSVGHMPSGLRITGHLLNGNFVISEVDFAANMSNGSGKKETGQKEENFDLSSFVPKTGFEPAHGFPRCDLNTVRLPISPLGHSVVANITELSGLRQIFARFPSN